MNKLSNIFFLFFLIVFSSCENKTENPISNLPESSSKINNVSIIIDETLWNSEVGDTVRKKFAAPVDGLPQEEPLFTLNQYPTKIFDGFVKKSRNIILVQKGEKTGYKAEKNVFAYPQNVFYVSGKTLNDINQVIELKSNEIVETIKKAELVENLKRIKKSTISNKEVADVFGITMEIGAGYQYDMVRNKFIWLRKEFKSGYNSILIYEVPFARVEKNKDYIPNITKIRDSIGQANIHGVLKNTWMITEEAYLPYLFNVKIDNKETFLTKGTWVLKNDFMGGPFVNYAIKDTKNKRYLMVEGFTYLPSNAKRDWVFELEAMINSIKFKNQK